MNLKVIWAIPALLLLATGCVNREAQAQAKKTEALVTKESRSVSATTVEVRNLTDTFPITGQLVTDADTQLSAKVGGRLVAVYVKDGDRVGPGQLIAQIESTNQAIQVQQAMAGVNAARSQLNQALANARIAPQRSRAAVDAARAQLRQANAQLAKARRGARTEEIAQARAAVQAAKSNMETAKRNRDRQANLLGEGATSQAAFEQADNLYQGALAQYIQAVEAEKVAQSATRPEDIETARELVRQAEEGVRQAVATQRLDITLTDQVAAARANLASAEAQLRLAQQQLSDTKVFAMAGGTVSGNPLTAGTVVSPGMPILRLIGQQGVYFEGDVPASAIQRVKVGSAVDVKIDGLADQSLAGTVSSLSPSASSVGRLFKARITIPVRGDLSVKPGMFARGAVVIREVSGARVVPSAAVVRRGDKWVVYLVDGDSAREAPVTKGLEQDGLTQVMGGVNPGDRVIVRGVNDLENGTKIEVEKPAETRRQEKSWA